MHKVTQPGVPQCVLVGLILTIATIPHPTLAQDDARSNTKEELSAEQGDGSPGALLRSSWESEDGQRFTFGKSNYFVFDANGEVVQNGRFNFDEKMRMFSICSSDGKAELKISVLDDTTLIAEGLFKTGLLQISTLLTINAKRLHDGIALPPITTIHDAATYGDIDVLREFLARDEIDIDQQDELGTTPLHRAAYACHTRSTVLLLDNGADPNAMTANGKSALHLAIESDHVEAVEALFAAGVVASEHEDDGKSLLEIATSASSQMIILLVKMGANLRANNRYGRSVLGEIMSDVNVSFEYVERLDVTKFVFDNNLYGINEADSEGLTPIFHAAKNGLVDTTKYLLAKGARTDLTDAEGFSLTKYVSLTQSPESPIWSVLESN